MGCDLVIVARTDALSATYLDSNIDSMDHPFILGCVDQSDKTKLMTFPEAGRKAIMNNFNGAQKDRMLKNWDEVSHTISLEEARSISMRDGF
jgi:isocitrate lyase